MRMADQTTEDMFKQFTDQASKQYLTFYEEFVGKFLRMPPLGIGRETIGESMAAGDAYHKLSVALGEFLQHFSAPFTETLANFGENMDETADNIDTTQAFYHAFMQMLNQKYESYLQSPDGVNEVSALIDQYLEFKQRLDGAMQPWMEFYNIPSQKDMQAVYQKLHQLKRKNRDLEKMVKQQSSDIQVLRQKIDALEKLSSGAGTAKKRSLRTKPKTTRTRSTTPKKTPPKKKARASSRG
jgi:polyhydroxyalkanoate synthesis regulator phasin